MTTEQWLDVAWWATIISVVVFLLGLFMEEPRDKDKNKPA